MKSRNYLHSYLNSYIHTILDRMELGKAVYIHGYFICMQSELGLELLLSWVLVTEPSHIDDRPDSGSIKVLVAPLKSRRCRVVAES